MPSTRNEKLNCGLEPFEIISFCVVQPTTQYITESIFFFHFDSIFRDLNFILLALMKQATMLHATLQHITEAKDIKKRWQEYTEELYKKDLHDPDNHDGMITHLEPDILEFEVKWALGSITTNKASGGNGIPVELLQILKDNAVKVLHSICQQIWKTQQWPQDWKRSDFTPIPKNDQTTNCTHFTC